ncbi:MAG: MFS transporter [Thainema sp.]
MHDVPPDPLDPRHDSSDVSSYEEQPKLPLATKIAYGAGDAGAGITSNLIVFSFLIFLTNVAGVDPLAAGTVLLIGNIWDAINDPLIGVLSDRTRTRWGRRYPWMFLAGIPFGITFFLTWLVPDFGATGKFWYYVITSLVFQIFFTAVNLPYTTLTAEITEDYDERTELTTFRISFSLFGAVLALALGLLISSQIENQQLQYAVLGGVCGLVSIIPIYWCIFGTYPQAKQRTQAVQQIDETDEEVAIADQIKIFITNVPFLMIIGIYMFSWLALQVTATVIPFYVEFWMGLDDYFLAALLVQGTSILMVYGCNQVSKKAGKRGLYFLGMAPWIAVQFFLLFLQPGQTLLMYILCVIVSIGVATAYVVPWSMLPDAIDLDELRSGQRREGIFYAFMTLLQKIGRGVGLFLVSAALSASGFVAGSATQPESALWAIRLMMGLMPMVLLILGLVLAYFYPITRETHAEILLRLRERRLAKNNQ